MGALGLETVLVGDVLDGVDDAVSAGVGELAADFESFVLGSKVLQHSILGGGDAVGGFHAVW